jgi:hypothetical protein
MDRYDVYAQFAQRHLSTRSEQAAHAALASGQAVVGSRPGPQAALAPAAVAQSLRQDAAAGIVEELDTAEQRRYRWRADRGSLFGTHRVGVVSLTRCVTCRNGGQPVPGQRSGRPGLEFCSSAGLTASAAAPYAFSRPVG